MPAYGQFGEWFGASIPRFAVGMNFGALELEGNHYSMGVYANVLGFTMTAEGITDAPSVGEDQYGMGHLNDDPDYYEYLFGYEIPIYSNLHNKTNGFAIYLTPLIGSVTEAYYYSDLYYGNAVRAKDSSRMSYGGMCSFRIGGPMAIQISFKASTHGMSGGFAFCFGKGFFGSN